MKVNHLNSKISITDNIVGAGLSMSSILVWPLMLTLPLLLSSSYSFTSYKSIFPSSWYEYNDFNTTPKPLGLSLGILAVAIGQFFVVSFFYLYRNGYYHLNSTKPTPIQIQGAPSYEFWQGVTTHLSQPEGFVLLTIYLSGTWMLKLMPKSYYSFEGGIDYYKVFLCLALQDGVQYTMHRLEHVVSMEFYRKSHKPHHRFTNPKLLDFWYL
jgi:sterol desaturase/sphingolipid hydroxylase (fatty acid hydroxylase superfamily)